MKLRIKEWMPKGMTQAYLAQKAEVSESYLSEVISGAKDPSLKTTIRIADALGVTLYDLLPPGSVSPEALEILRHWPQYDPEDRELLERQARRARRFPPSGGRDE